MIDFISIARDILKGYFIKIDVRVFLIHETDSRCEFRDLYESGKINKEFSDCQTTSMRN